MAGNLLVMVRPPEVRRASAGSLADESMSRKKSGFEPEQNDSELDAKNKFMKANATDQMNEDIVTRLIELDNGALAELLRKVFVKKFPNPEEFSFSENKFFLATASREKESEKLAIGEWEIEAVAYIDRAEYSEGNGPDYGLCQFGECRKCRMKVRSNVKRAICPLCGSSVGLS